MKKYYAAGFFDEKLRGLSDNLLTNSFDEAVDKVHKMNAIDNGDIPEAAKRLV